MGIGMSVVLGAMKHFGFSKYFFYSPFHLGWVWFLDFSDPLEDATSEEFWAELSQSFLPSPIVSKNEFKDCLSCGVIFSSSLLTLVEVGPVLSSY